MKREVTIRALGYNLIVIWESEWNNIRKSIKKIQRMFRNRQ